jgi:hypothetical protein
MSWGRTSTGFDPQGYDPLVSNGPSNPAKIESIELVGPHLRVCGDISLLRFARLSDLVNQNPGYVRLTDARLLRRNGEPTNLVVQELMVNRDEITFIGQAVGDVSTAQTGIAGGIDRPLMEKVPRQLVIFTPGHTLTGTIFLFAETEIANFVDTPDPRFVAMKDVTARSLADRRVISHFALALVNRTQIAAASLLERAGGTDETGVMVE